MGFHFLSQFKNLLYLIWIGSFLQKVESSPVSNLHLLSPEVRNSSALLEHLKLRRGENRVPKHSGLFDVRNTNATAEKNVDKEHLRENSTSNIEVPYLCNIEKGTCWLNLNQENVMTYFIPAVFFLKGKPPSEMGLKEVYSLLSKKEKQNDMIDSQLNSTLPYEDTGQDTHPRRKRDTEYAEDSDLSQQEWVNQGEYNSDPPLRVQRNIFSNSTEHMPTSTEGHTQKNADFQAGKQSKRSAEMDDEDTEEEDFGSPSPDDDYQDDNSDVDYHPEKRFAGPETPGTTAKPGDLPSKSPSQPSRRSAMYPNYNYPYFANPDFVYPSQRMMNPFDGLSYRSVDAMPMMYVVPYQGFWPNKFSRSARQYYTPRQASGYGRGWGSEPSYHQQYGNRYQQNYPSSQQNRGHYHHQQSSYRHPFSYSYAQGNDYKSSRFKPVETDAHMYYGK